MTPNFLQKHKILSDRKLTLLCYYNASGKTKWVLVQYTKASHQSWNGKDSVLCNMWGGISILMGRREWLPHIKQCTFVTTWQAWHSKGMRMLANQLIIQNPPSQQELLILTPACTKSLINECFQLCRRQPIHTYCASSFSPISTAEKMCVCGGDRVLRRRSRRREASKNKQDMLFRIWIYRAKTHNTKMRPIVHLSTKTWKRLSKCSWTKIWKSLFSIFFLN